MSEDAGTPPATELTPESVVIRGGVLPQNRGRLYSNAKSAHEQTRKLRGTGIWAVCVGTHPTLPHEEIAAKWRFHGPTYALTTVERLAGYGFGVERDDDYRGLLLLPRPPTGKADSLWDLVDQAFAGPLYPNPSHSED